MNFNEKEDQFIVRNGGPRFLFFLKSRNKKELTELPAKESCRIEAGVMILFVAVLFSIGVVVFRAFHSSTN